MKNLAIIIGLVLCGVTYGQDSYSEFTRPDLHDKVEVIGVGRVSVGGLFTITALSREYTAFAEVMSKAKAVLEANGIEWEDQFDTESTIGFKHFEDAEKVHYKIVRGESVRISWLISTDDGVTTFAFLFLESTGFRFEIDSRRR